MSFISAENLTFSYDETSDKVLRGVSESLDAEALRVVSASPDWEPGKVNGKPVPVVYTFPVVYKLQ